MSCHISHSSISHHLSYLSVLIDTNIILLVYGRPLTNVHKMFTHTHTQNKRLLNWFSPCILAFILGNCLSSRKDNVRCWIVACCKFDSGVISVQLGLFGFIKVHSSLVWVQWSEASQAGIPRMLVVKISAVRCSVRWCTQSHHWSGNTHCWIVINIIQSN